MKITIYELLGLIKDGKAPKKIKEPQGSYTETYVFDEKEQWYITKDGTTKMNIWNKERLSNEIEILEEVEDKEYEDIGELCYNIKEFENDVVKLEYENKTMRIGRVIVDLSTKIDALIRNQKYILERVNKNEQ